jgi:hypothetical protein
MSTSETCKECRAELVRSTLGERVMLMPIETVRSLAGK